MPEEKPKRSLPTEGGSYRRNPDGSLEKVPAAVKPPSSRPAPAAAETRKAKE